MKDYTKPASSIADGDIPNEPITTKVVVSDGVSKRKKSIGKKFLDSFIAGDAKTIRDYAVQDVIIPAVKRTVSNLISNIVEMALFGEARTPMSNSFNPGRPSKYTSYSSYYEGERLKTVRRHEDYQQKSDYRLFRFKTPSDAEQVIRAMIHHIEVYDKVRISDLCDFCQEPHSPADVNYGWYDLTGADYKFVSDPDGDGYILVLPSPVPVNR